MSNTNDTVALDLFASVIAEHKALGIQEKVIKERRDQLTSIIRSAIGEGVTGTVGGVPVVTVPFRTNTNVDAKVVAELAPEVHAQALRLTPYRPVLHQK